MNTPHDPDDGNIERIGPVSTPGRVAAACIPILGMTITPLLPFAVTPTVWFGIPAVMVWMAIMVVLTVVILQFVDRGINRQAAQARNQGGDAS